MIRLGPILSVRSETTMIATPKHPMSAILKEMALTVLVDPGSVPSSEAKAAALLLSHVAWQRANGAGLAGTAYAPALADLQRARPAFWKELKSTDAERTIAELVAYKKRHHPHDLRKIVACASGNDKIRVEWTD